MENIIHGDELMVFIDGKSVAFAISHTMSVTGDTIDLNCKDTGIYAKQDIGNIKWEITSENLYTDNGYDALFDAMINRTLTTIVFGYASNYDEEGLQDIIPYWMPDTDSGYYIGEAYISSLTANANTGENATYSVTFTGSKALNISNAELPDNPVTPDDPQQLPAGYIGEIDSNLALQLTNYTIESTQNYSLRYEDANNNVIENFRPLYVSDYNLISENIAPYNADHFGLYNINERVASIRLNTLKKSFGTRKYRFGVLSDVHYDATQSNLYDASNDFRNAITFFENHEDVDFVVIPGDMTLSQSAGNYTDLEYFKSDMDEFAPTTPIFIARGNHDIGCLSNLSTAAADAKWNEYATSSNLNGITPIYQYDNGNKTANFYFTYQGDVFIFLSLYTNSFWPAATGTNAFLESSYDWLHDLLEANKNKRVFVIEHLYLRDKAGNYKGHYNTTFNSWFTCNGDFAKFNALNNTYKNSIWIQGHTHFKLYLQRDYNRANITNINPDDGTKCGYNIHISSCGCPRNSHVDVANWTTSMINEYNGSEGAIIDVYDDYIDYRGIVFKNELDGDFSGNSRLLTASDLFVDSTKQGATITSSNDYNCIVTFTGQSQRVFIDYTNITNATNYIIVEDIKVTDGNGNDVTSTLKAMENPKVGFYGTDGKYHLGTCTVNIWDGNLELPCSSSFSAATLPVTVSFNARLAISAGYTNKYLPVAQYRIPVNNQGVQS